MAQGKCKRIQAAKSLFDRNISWLRCPVCKKQMATVYGNSLLCNNGHCFDIAKQGYVNLLYSDNSEIYDKALFKARHSVFECGFYQPVLQEIERIIKIYVPDDKKMRILDTGCGEGYFLRGIAALKKADRERPDSEYSKEENRLPEITYMGIDISKAGIIEAARASEDALWCISDITNVPTMDNTVDVLLNILAPANYAEFARVLSKDGIVIKIVPEMFYLKEIRASAKKWLRNWPHPGEAAADAAQEHLKILEKNRITYQREVNCADYMNFVKMTPMTALLTEEARAELVKNLPNGITIDLSVILGKNV